MKASHVVLSTVLVLALPAAAHEVTNGPNGGRVVEAGPHHIELVVQNKTVNLFVTDSDDKPVAVSSFKGLAILTVSGKAQRIPLEPKDGVLLTGTSALTLPAAPSGVVQVTGPDGKTAQGKFH
jgi:methionine-rich copper-binding protein CopC